MHGEHLEFESGSIDVVSLSNTLHHLPNKEKVLSEIKRVLKPRGIVLINEMICDNQSEKQLSHVELHHFQGEIDTLLGICHNSTYTLKELVQIVNNAGFERVQMFQYNTNEEQLRSENLEEEKVTLDQCFQAMEAKLHKISDEKQKELYLKRLEKMKEKLYPVGFFTATEVMIVCRI
jgi:SAM-dependent methyltransferase